MKGGTIAALCTSKGKSALSVLRISGPKALEITKQIAPFLPAQPESHRVYFGTLKEGKKELDQVLIAYFEKGRSFTGEESLEISCHGGEIYTEVLKALLEKGARPAEKGEFSLQAFSNGKMDLVQAEALGQLIEAKSSLARSQALFQLKGNLSKKFLELEKNWLFLLSHVEADIDFSLENLNLLEEKQYRKKLKELKKKLEEMISCYRPFEKLQDGLVFGIFGRTNAGKSSLFNALLEEDRVIVSKEEGTTRDVVEGQLLNPEGLNILLKDCAGFRESHSEGERKGQKKSWEVFKNCDDRLLLLDSLSLDLEEELFKGLEKSWLVFTKSDLLEKAWEKNSNNKSAYKRSVKALKQKDSSYRGDLRKKNQKLCSASYKKELVASLKKKYKNIISVPKKTFLVSSVSGEGISELRKEILACGAMQSEDYLISNSRHYKALNEMKKTLENCEKINFERDIIALELRQGLLALYEILGKQIEDKVLDQIFKQFCIGK